MYRFPASLSTNAAVMASAVMASRLPSTTHVFSLTLFSIEVFGLFPVFRRQLRSISWRGHLRLTYFLVLSASGGMGVIISAGGLIAAIVGTVLGSVLTFLVMGICSWWLIGLQKYKNEMYGPWDPARPIIRRHWD
jgi:phosphatidylinositol glycan class C protein